MGPIVGKRHAIAAPTNNRGIRDMPAFSRPPRVADPAVAPASSGRADPGKHTLIPQLDASVAPRQVAGDGAHDDASVRAVASDGIATPASAPPHGDTIQRLFGRHDISIDHRPGAPSPAGRGVQRRAARDDTQILAHQTRLKNTDVEIPALEGALLATRKEAVEQGLLSQASFDAGLAFSQAMTQLQPAVAANGSVDPWQQQLAALAAQRLFASLQRETADEKNFDALTSPARASTGDRTQNRYTGELRSPTYLLWREVQHTVYRHDDLPDLIRQGRWTEAFRGYRHMFDGLDLWVADQLRMKGKGTPEASRGNAHQYNAQLRSGLEQVAGKHATRLPALFHPDAKLVEEEKRAGRPAADTIPMNVYFWKDDRDGTFHLYDLTTPGRPHEQTIDGPPSAAIMTTFFEEVARYPEGEVRYALPGGVSGIATTTGKTKWYEWVGYAGLAIAGVGLALVTGGASIPATICFAAGAIASGVSAGGHLVDTAGLGTATSASVVLDVAQIVTSFASFGAMSITVKAGGAAAALGGSRWFVPLVSTAAGADIVQLIALGDLTFVELDKLRQGAGSPEDKQRAMAVLFSQLVVMGGITALSVQGARGARVLAEHPLEVVEQSGATVLRIAGDASVPAERVIEVVQRHRGSVRGALAELNQLGFTQAQMREALEAAWRFTGRATAGALTADDGTVVLLSRRVGPNQPVNLVRPDGTAEFGTGELFIDPSNLASPVRARSVRAGDWTALRMPGEPLPVPSSNGPVSKPPAGAEAGVSERLEALARDPDHGGKVTDQTRREAQVALDLERQGKLAAPVRRPVPGDGHSGDFVDGAGGDWDVKAYKSRQSIIDGIRTKMVASGRPAPVMDAAKRVPGEFELETAMKQLRTELRAGERLIIDTEGLSPEDLGLLKDAVKREKLDAQVIFYE